MGWGFVWGSAVPKFNPLGRVLLTLSSKRYPTPKSLLFSFSFSLRHSSSLALAVSCRLFLYFGLFLSTFEAFCLLCQTPMRRLEATFLLHFSPSLSLSLFFSILSQSLSTVKPHPPSSSLSLLPVFRSKTHTKWQALFLDEHSMSLFLSLSPSLYFSHSFSLHLQLLLIFQGEESHHKNNTHDRARAKGRESGRVAAGCRKRKEINSEARKKEG